MLIVDSSPILTILSLALRPARDGGRPFDGRDDGERAVADRR